MQFNFFLFFFLGFKQYKLKPTFVGHRTKPLLTIAPAFLVAALVGVSFCQNQVDMSLQKFNGLSKALTMNRFFKRLQKKGKLTNQRVLENFLMYVKWKFQVNPMAFLAERFFLQYELPFYLEVVTFSNRNYMFPEPFANYAMSQKFFIKKFGNVIRKRSETFYLNRIFTELLHFFNKNQQSYLRDSLDAVMQQGLENRSYVHYRWLIRR